MKTTIKNPVVIINAAFAFAGGWKWITFTTNTANICEAISGHAKEIGAKAWDVGQASMMVDGECVEGHPSVFV